MTLSAHKKLYLKAREAYYNATKPIMSDRAFDELEDSIREQDPLWSELGKTGVKPKKADAKLPQFMPSLNKIYPEHTPKWLARYPADRYISMDKLDGSSLYLSYRGGRPSSLITRGDGEIGGDISFLLPHLRIPKRIKNMAHLEFRCEAVMPRRVFDKHYADKFENARNFVNGLFNRRTASPALAHTDIVVLGLFNKSLREGLQLASTLGFSVVQHRFSPALDTNELVATLEKRRSASVYDIDGLVVADAKFVVAYESSDKPKGITAFKVNDVSGAAEAVVNDIIWQVTRHGRIIPKIEITPVRLDGATVTYATVHNAKWMKDRKIGPGAVVQVLRSGGVIPKIVGVVKAGKFKEPDIHYEQKGVHFMVAEYTEESDTKMQALAILHFMRTLGIEHLAEKTIRKLLAQLKDVPAWVDAWARGDLQATLEHAEFGEKTAARIVGEFDRVLSKTIPSATLAVALSCFDPGVGRRRLAMLESAGISMKQLLIDVDPTEAILAVHGFSSKTAALVVSGLETYRRMLKRPGIRTLKIRHSLPMTKPKVVREGQLSGQYVTFTGYRDKDQEASVERAGGEIVPFGSKTTILVYKEGGKTSSKIEKARSRGICVVTWPHLKVK